MACTVTEFGTLESGEKVYAYTLDNGELKATVLNFGGILQKLLVKDKDGDYSDIVCGFDTIEDYLADGAYFGSLVGRYANRINKGKFVLNGKTVSLACNESGCKHIHGGVVGYNRRVWEVIPCEEDSLPALECKLVSPDGEEGYPAKLDISVKYILDGNMLKLKYFAMPDAPTIVNLTNHSYFNMSGYASGNIKRHTLQVLADKYTEVDPALIPTGRLPSVSGTKFDLRIPTELVHDYDHNFVIRDWDGTLRKAAVYYDKLCGRGMEVYTTLPGIQIYSAVNMDGPVNFKDGVPQNKHCACCFETQYFPDTPNRDGFPSCVFTPENPYESETQFRFFTK